MIGKRYVHKTERSLANGGGHVLAHRRILTNTYGFAFPEVKF